MKRVLITILFAGVCLAGVVRAQAPAPSDEWSNAMAAGDKAFAEGNFDEADKQFGLARNRADRLDRLVMSYYVLAQVQRARGNYAEAERLYKVGLGIIEKDLGKGYESQRAYMMQNLAETAKAQGKLQEAQEWTQKAQELARQMQAAQGAAGQAPAPEITTRQQHAVPAELAPQIGPVTCLDLPATQFAAGVPNSAELANRLNGIGEACLADKKFAPAEDYFRRSVSIFVSVGGAENPLTCPALIGMARAQRERGNLPGAAQSATHALAILDRAGRKDASVIEALQVNAQVLEAYGRHKDAQGAMRRLIASQQQAGKPASEIIATIADLAVSLQADGKHRDAQTELKRGIEMAERASAKPESSRMRTLLAQSYLAEGNQHEATKLVEDAARAGDAQAQALFGAALERDQDYRNALIWYRKAGDQGNALGQVGAASIYERGLGLSHDVPEALVDFATKWYRKAAQQGDPTAQYKLGTFCEQGKGMLRNLTEALAWYSLAADRNAEAKARLDELTKKLSAADIEEAHKRAQELAPAANPAKTN